MKQFGFQSTAPLGVPTKDWFFCFYYRRISIHGTLGGADVRPRLYNSDFLVIFQSTAPLGVPTGVLDRIDAVMIISIHGTLGGADKERQRIRKKLRISIHGTLGGADEK